MDELKNEGKLCGQSIQNLDIELLLQDDEAFENVFFPPSNTDYNPMNINEIIDFDEMYAILNEGDQGNVNDHQGLHFVVGNYEDGLSDQSYINVGTNQLIMSTNGEPMNVEPPKPKHDQRVIKRWSTRRRIQKGSKEAEQKKELNKIRNREAAARAFAEKKAYIKWLELEAQRYRKKNANLKRLIEFDESNISSDMTRKQLRRTSSLD